MVEKRVVDLRSDTVTKPSPEMLQAMVEAEVGDDVLGDDPTVIALQEKVAKLLGTEAALFVPSGSMGNQAAIRAQTQPGDEIIAHADSHIYHYEGGAPFAISGCSISMMQGKGGIFDADQVRSAVRPVESHFAQSRLVVIENTHNRGGGSIWPIERIQDIRKVADEFGLSMHLDGARLMNASVAAGIKPSKYAELFDTVSVCFSKGLGAPVGSAVAGTTEMIRRVHRFRKMFGGGMRQSGILAAAAVYALDHNIDGLAQDHANAKRLAEALSEMPGFDIDLAAVETNIVYFDAAESVGSAAEVCACLHDKDVWMMAIGPKRVRAVTHRDVDTEGIDRAIEVLQTFGAR